MATAKTIAYGAYGTLGYATSGTSVSVAYPSGIVWGMVPVEIKAEVEGS